MNDQSSQLSQYVHIIPVGQDIDRIVAAFGGNLFLAHRVHLLLNSTTPEVDPSYAPQTNEWQQYYNEQVCFRLTKKKIEVIEHQVNLFNILNVMSITSWLIKQEQKDGHQVYVNMSACGKLASLGATLAAMANGAEVYSVKADRYSISEDERREHGFSVVEHPRIMKLENFSFALPDELAKYVIVYILQQGGKGSIENILIYLIENKIDGYVIDYRTLSPLEGRKLHQQYLMRLQNLILKKLESAGYITRKREGNNVFITVTPSGSYVAAVSGITQE
jgi:hypothetical protein